MTNDSCLEFSLERVCPSDGLEIINLLMEEDDETLLQTEDNNYIRI